MVLIQRRAAGFIYDLHMRACREEDEAKEQRSAGGWTILRLGPGRSGRNIVVLQNTPRTRWPLLSCSTKPAVPQRGKRVERIVLPELVYMNMPISTRHRCSRATARRADTGTTPDPSDWHLTMGQRRWGIITTFLPPDVSKHRPPLGMS